MKGHVRLFACHPNRPGVAIVREKNIRTSRSRSPPPSIAAAAASPASSPLPLAAAAIHRCRAASPTYAGSRRLVCVRRRDRPRPCHRLACVRRRDRARPCRRLACVRQDRSRPSPLRCGRSFSRFHYAFAPSAGRLSSLVTARVLVKLDG